jgi:hypothetical protein
MKPQMQIQKTDCYELKTQVVWLEPDLVQLKVTTINQESRGAETRNQSYFMTPEELMRLADYINDCLCR